MKSIMLKVVISLNLLLIWGVFIILIITPPLFIIALIYSPFDRQGSLVHRLACFWSRIVLKSCFFKVRVEGKANVTPGEPYVFMANHSSVIDHLVLLAYLPTPFRYVGKEEAFSLPFFGWVFNHARYIPINRSNPREGFLSLERTAETIKDGVSIVIYPEGTRSKDGKIHAFKRGGFFLAAKTDHRIIPVSVSGAQRIIPTKSRKVRPGSIKMVLGQPIASNGMERAEQTRLMEEVREAILANYDPEYGVRN